MSNHKNVLVPIESWIYASPDLKMAGKDIDIGLFAEALIYYENVIVNPGNQLHFASFIQWFINQGCLDNFYDLLKDGTLKIYDYSFMSTAVEKDGEYSLWNIQDAVQAQKNTFEQRYLYHKSVECLFPKSKQRIKLYNAIRDNVIEVKSDDFGAAIENAREDFNDPRRYSIIVQALVDEIYKLKNLGRPPKIETSVSKSFDGTKTQIIVNTDFNHLAMIAGENLGFHTATPLTASAHSNRLIWSAADMKCDLYLPRPMSILVGDKFYESKERVTKSGDIIEDLKAAVEFPDVRRLVNSGQLRLMDILKIRKKSAKFRSWLQQENGRDRDAIIAYHNEVSKELGLIAGARKTLSLFGVLGGGTVGTALGSFVSDPAIGGAVGGVAGGAISYLAEVSSKIGADWKPVVFGDWMKERIEKVISDNH